jgi:hypothetical protein
VAATGTGFACGSRRTSLARRKAGGTGTERGPSARSNLIFCLCERRASRESVSLFGMVHNTNAKIQVQLLQLRRRVITQGTYHRVHIGYIVTFNAFTWHPACP